MSPEKRNVADRFSKQLNHSGGLKSTSLFKKTQTSKLNVHLSADVPKHNAVAALPSFVILPLIGLFYDGLLPHDKSMSVS